MSEFQSPLPAHQQGRSPFEEKWPATSATNTAIATAESPHSPLALASGGIAAAATKPAPHQDVSEALGHWADNSHGNAPHQVDEKPGKTKTTFQPVIKGQYLHLSESDPTVVGFQFHNKWMVAVSGGKSAPIATATVGTLRVAKEVTIVEMQAATPGDSGWKLQGESVGILIQGDAAKPVAMGEVARRGGGKGWQLHGKHGSKDKLAPEIEAALEEDDQVELKGMNAPAIWMRYPEGTEKENPAGWAQTDHSKQEVAARRKELETDAKNLPADLRDRILAHLDVLATVSTVEGGYQSTSGTIGDTSGSLGIFQWARPRDPTQGSDSLDRFFSRMQQRGNAGKEKEKNKEKPTSEEALAIKAWGQVEKRGIGVDHGHTTFKQGTEMKPASATTLELAMMGKEGLQHLYQASMANAEARNLGERLKQIRQNAKGKSDEEEKKDEVRYLGTVTAQLALACKDVLTSDLAKGSDGKAAPIKGALEKMLARLEPKKETPEKGTKGAAPTPQPGQPVQNHDATPLEQQPEEKSADSAVMTGRLDKQIQEKSQLIREADALLRPLLDQALRTTGAAGMAAEEMRQYQLLGALDTLKELQSRRVYPSLPTYVQALLPGSSVSQSSASLQVDGRSLQLHSAGLAYVGDFLKSEKGLAEMAMLGVNRPAYVECALWRAVQSADPVEEAPELARAIFRVVDKVDAARQSSVTVKSTPELASAEGKATEAKKTGTKRTAIKEGDLPSLLATAPEELKAEAAAVLKSIANLKTMLWPQSGQLDEAEMLTRFRSEAMRIYGIRERGDANDHNRVGRFVTIELVDWNAVDAVKAK